MRAPESGSNAFIACADRRNTGVDDSMLDSTGRNRKGNRLRKPTLAERTDRHVLYEKSVQNADAELDFVSGTFTKLRGRPPRVLREDFCGTANLSCAWVRRHRRNLAYCIDIDAGVLDWGRRNRLSTLNAAQERRIRLINDDVLAARCPRADVVLAMNFSYWVFKDRKTMKRYFRRIHDGLVRDGVLFLDAFGGYEASREMEESTEYNGFTYIWDQASYNPVNGDITCHIHFRFKDGSRLRRAFSYHWRLWTLPELAEMLQESGFRATVYWEGTDEHGEGDGNFTPTVQGEADAGWVAYIVAEK